MILIILSSLAMAASLSVNMGAPSPLVGEERLLASLRELCGEPESDVPWAQFRDVHTERCDIWFDGEAGLFTVRLNPGAQPERLAALSSPEREEVTAEDWRLFQLLGFDPTEVGEAHTLEVASDHQDVATGRDLGTAFVATKTFFFRQVEGYPVPSSRVIVTRDVDGSVRSIVAAWPDFEGAMVVQPDGGPVTASEAAGLLGLEGATVQRQVLHAAPVAGGADVLVVVDEVIPTFDEATAEKITSYNLIDGRIFNPLSEDAWYSYF